ncbi:MAG TPA: haloacid dehalogenase, partial [Roseiflexaceae bacterium]|nr:haloacid dehalogenase [Roseiflexaceae bacterium]
MTIDTVVGEVVTRIEAAHTAREQALSMSRALVRQCANAIRAVHRAEFEDAEQQLREATRLVRELRDA